jgi:hypothetical protein
MSRNWNQNQVLKPDLVLEPEPNLGSNLELKSEPKTKSGFFENIFWKKKKKKVEN